MESQYHFWKMILIIAPSILVIITGIAGYKTYMLDKKIKEISGNQNRLNQEQDKKDIIEAIQISKAENYIEDINYKGYSVSFLLTFLETQNQRRKFILDIGSEVNKNRVSLYLDIKDNLVYRIIDSEGESHVIKVPKKGYTFQYNTPYFVLFEYGFKGQNSFMRLFINNEEVGRVIFKYKISIPNDIDWNKMIIWADIEKKNNGKFTLSFIAGGKETFTNKQRENMMKMTFDFIETFDGTK